jgi:hypothetical protein
MPRPRLVPTEEQRKNVKSLAAIGVRQHDIAHFINVRSPKTLRKYFREEIDRGELEGYAKVKQTQYQMATDGKHPQVTEAWLASYERRHGRRPEMGATANPPTLTIVRDRVSSPGPAMPEKKAA